MHVPANAMTGIRSCNKQSLSFNKGLHSKTNIADCVPGHHFGNGNIKRLPGGIKQVLHLHCEHFEPFRRDMSHNMMAKEHVAHWVQEAKKRPFAARSAVFYSTQRFCVIPQSSKPSVTDGGRWGAYLSEDDPFWFVLSSMADQDEEVLAHLDQEHMDIQVHIHHEHWSSGPVTKTEPTPYLDGMRLSLYLSLYLDYLKHTCSKPFDQWAFVHGCWALNASDTEICQITDEIEILRRHGCVADFTFPAGRHWCDPDEPSPYTIDSCTMAAGYRATRAHPRRVGPGSGAFDGNRFLIWSTSAPYHLASVEGFHEYEPSQLVHGWLSECPVIDGTLLIKTHCHSMWWEYWKGPRDTNTPLLQDHTAKVFDMLHATKVPVEHVNATEMISRLRRIDADLR